MSDVDDRAAARRLGIDGEGWVCDDGSRLVLPDAGGEEADRPCGHLHQGALRAMVETTLGQYRKRGLRHAPRHEGHVALAVFANASPDLTVSGPIDHVGRLASDRDVLDLLVGWAEAFWALAEFECPARRVQDTATEPFAIQMGATDSVEQSDSPDLLDRVVAGLLTVMAFGVVIDEPTGQPVSEPLGIDRFRDFGSALFGWKRTSFNRRASTARIARRLAALDHADRVVRYRG